MLKLKIGSEYFAYWYGTKVRVKLLKIGLHNVYVRVTTSDSEAWTPRSSLLAQAGE